MDREATKQIRESKRKERLKKNKKSRKTLIMLIASKKLAKKELIKQQWANFIATWSSLVVKEVGDKFHSNFKVGMQVEPSRYRGVNLGSITSAHKQTQLRAKVRMQTRKEVVTSLQL
jgi:hypothetical protein